MGLEAGGALHEASPEGGILPSVLLWDQLIPACGFASLMGFVPGRCLQGHKELGQIPRKDPFIPLILQEDPLESPQPGGVPGVGPTAEQLQSLQEAQGQTSEPKAGTRRGVHPQYSLFDFSGGPKPRRVPQEGAKGRMEGAAGWGSSVELSFELGVPGDKG